MPKRLRFFISSCVAAGLFFFILSLPFDFRYFFLGISSLLVVMSCWFAQGSWKEPWVVKLMVVIMPLLFFVSYCLFSMLLPFSIELLVVLTGVLVGIFYLFFLVNNIFLVALSFKTVPLYRAAWTVSLLLTLLTSFFAYNTLWSFRFYFWLNSLLVFFVSMLLFAYTYWVISIEAGSKEVGEISPFILVPSLICAELALVFSFWPVGIFNGSLYLVWCVFILASLKQASLRERLFKKTWLSFLWMTGAVVLAAVVTTSWR